jgi:hypothetical protein
VPSAARWSAQSTAARRVEVFGVLHREALEHQQHAVGQARPEAQAVGGFHVGHAAHGRGVLALVKAKPRPFGEQAFKAFGAGEEEFETVRHEYSRALGYLMTRRRIGLPMFSRTPFQQACGWPGTKRAAKGLAA